MSRPDLVRRHLSPYVLAYVRTRRRIRAAVAQARLDGCNAASFARFMDAVCPDWRRER